ncbi:MAG: universal stress protein [Thermodesulfobacteriota bacterium]|nr:universal stress protein [Thermodesulfobacteriota bacterium]
MEKKYKHILVPLDESKLAEVALIDAAYLAKLCEAEVTLLRVIRPINDVIKLDEHNAIFIDEQWQIKTNRGKEYLKSVSKKLKSESIEVHNVVETGPAAETIIEFAHKGNIDIIVMATHGRSGIKRWVYGSVADKVLRGAHLPILLVRAYPEEEI